jgi:hypothetical protein
MRYYHRHSFFPLVVIVLTILLGALIAITVLPNEEPTRVVDEETSVDAGSYRENLTNIVREFENGFSQAVDGAGQKRAGAQALQALLDLRVPAEYKNLHLELAVFLSSVESGSTISDPLGTLQTIVETYPWLYSHHIMK